MREDAVELHEHDPHHLAALGHFDPHELLDRHHVGAVVYERREVVHAVREGDDLIPRPVLAQLLERGVEVSDVGNDAHHRFAVELAHEPQHSVGGGVLGADVDEHVLRAEIRLGNVERHEWPERNALARGRQLWRAAYGELNGSAFHGRLAPVTGSGERICLCPFLEVARKLGVAAHL